MVLEIKSAGKCLHGEKYNELRMLKGQNSFRFISYYMGTF